MHKINLEVFTTQGTYGIRVRPKTITEKQLNLQVQLNTIHENIREFLSGIEPLQARLIKIENATLYLFH
jgi:hypothetical protein